MVKTLLIDSPVITGSKVKIHTEDTLLHADDEMISLEELARVTVELQAGVLEFLVGGRRITTTLH